MLYNSRVPPCNTGSSSVMGKFLLLVCQFPYPNIVPEIINIVRLSSVIPGNFWLSSYSKSQTLLPTSFPNYESR
jgi:hypothetical protein